MTPLTLGAAMLVAGLLGYTWSRGASLTLIVLSVVWVYVDVQPEGFVLWEISAHHGVVVADLGGLLGLLTGVALLVRGPGPRALRRGRHRLAE